MIKDPGTVGCRLWNGASVRTDRQSGSQAAEAESHSDAISVHKRALTALLEHVTGSEEASYIFSTFLEDHLVDGDAALELFLDVVPIIASGLRCDMAYHLISCYP